MENSLLRYASPVVAIAEEAAALLMRYYAEPLEVTIKNDHSPVTKADIAANDFIVGKLKELTPEIPVIAEESNALLPDATTLKRFWLVDPLDGTKSFIKRTGEFTVNIGLVDEGKPVLGVVVVPVTGEE